MALKKKFIKIEVPMLNEEIMALGTPETLAGKTIKLDLSRKLRGRNLEVVFVLKNIEGKVIGFPKRLELMKQYIIRMMRKRVNYVEDSFEAQCKDIPCTIKPFLITRKKVSRSIRHSLRKIAKEFLTEYTKDKPFLEICERTLYAEIQKEMLSKLKKIYPLSFCEIRVLETKKISEADLTHKVKAVVEDIQEVEETKAIPMEKEESEEKTAEAEEETKKISKKKTLKEE